MSDVMLCGILRMPYELWKDDPLQEPQVLSRMREAASELERRADEIERLLAAWRWADPHLESMRGIYPEFDTALEHHRKAMEGK